LIYYVRVAKGIYSQYEKTNYSYNQANGSRKNLLLLMTTYRIEGNSHNNRTFTELKL